MLKRQQKRYKRHRRIRAKISGTAEIPRLCVFRSVKHIYTQLIDDEKGKTLVGASDLELDRKTKKPKNRKTKKQKNQKTEKPKNRKTKKEMAYEVGKLIAEKARKLKIEKVVFDRKGYKYHGRVKAVADGAREGGLKF